MENMLKVINKSRDDMTSLVSNTNNIDLTKDYVTLLQSVEDLIKSI